MGHRIDDGAVKAELARYRSGEERSYRIIAEMLSPYIYNYPRASFGADPDVCGGYYEYVLGRLEDILGGYRETGAKFLTWFTVVLRNRYLNFLRERKGAGRIEAQIHVVSLDRGAGPAGCSQGDRSLHEIIPDGRCWDGDAAAGFDETVDALITSLRENQRIYFHLYFVESMRPEDLAFLAIHLKRTVREILAGLRDVRLSMEGKYRLKNELHRRLGSLYYDILRGQRQGDAGLVERSKKKREKVLDEYGRVKLNPSYESIAAFLGLPLGTVSTGIMRMKRSARTFFEERSREKMPVQ